MTETSSRNHKHKRSLSKKNTPKDYSIVVGIFLVVGGLIMCMYSFDMFQSAEGLLQLPDIDSILQLWPIFIVLIGFAFVLKDYLRKSKTQKWNS